MQRFLRIAVSLTAMLLVAVTNSAAQTDVSHLKPGDSFPSITGQTLSGKQMELPGAASARPAVVILSFSRAGGHDSQTWSQHLSKNVPGLPIYTVIFLESVPRLFRGMAISGIKSGMPATMQDRTVLLYQDSEAWERKVRLGGEDHACVVLLKASGAIEWLSSEGFSDASYSGLLKQLQMPG
ncbi:MAG: hypothetical protein ABSE51_15635 [Terracidiphilus sp.]|jgi:hypothetical protein